MKLNLGCGDQRLPGFINVDMYGDPDVTWNLEKTPWPWEDSSVSEVVMSHVMEHLGATTDRYFAIIQELYRICKPDAAIGINVPHPRHDNYINDPTHVRPITPDGLALFSRARNEEWVRMGIPNTPLALQIGVDFEVESFKYALDDPWLTMVSRGELDHHGMLEAERKYNNVVSVIEIVWRVRK
ncbi:MAG: hypothetical protein HQL53_09875 [Magnetococcales bacterium]|nr:hypothetical protein [Magnetococcales bacterium]